MPGKITSLLDPARIQLHLQSTDHAAALIEISQLLRDNADVTDFDGFFEALLARDRLDTTNLGNGIALPHARTEHVTRIVMAVGRSDAGIAFETNGDVVKLFFVLGTPKEKPGDYLAVLSALCKILRDPADRTAIFNAATPDAFIAAIRKVETRLKL